MKTQNTTAYRNKEIHYVIKSTLTVYLGVIVVTEHSFQTQGPNPLMFDPIQLKNEYKLRSYFIQS